MSYEGYERRLCKNGHLSENDCYISAPDKCPECREPFVWWEGVDQTNDEGHPTKLRVKTKKATMIKVWDYTYYLPRNSGHRIDPTKLGKDEA